METLSRGWDTVGRRLAGATMSLPALDVDDESQPLHQPKTSATSCSLATAAANGDQHAAGSAAAAAQSCRCIIFGRRNVNPQSHPDGSDVVPVLLALIFFLPSPALNTSFVVRLVIFLARVCDPGDFFFCFSFFFLWFSY